MVWSVVQSYVPWLAGPLALAVAIWTFFRQLQQVQKTQAEVDNIKGRLGPDIMKTVEEARKLHQESTKIPMEVERIRAEIRKLTEEIRQLKASAIAAEISTNRTRIAADQIVKCIDEIRDRAKESHLAAEDAYEVLFRENPTERDVKDALQKRILPFVNRYKERGPLQGNLAELEV